MRILVAPDSFKGSLSAVEAARAMARGVAAAAPGASIDVCPLSDGGEGFASVLLATETGAEREHRVTGPLGTAVSARFVLLDGGRTALIESAHAIGLGLVPEEARAATRTTTYGIGELIVHAAASGARRILVGLGGTATTDGGAGMAQALGVTLAPAPSPVRGSDLLDVERIDVGTRSSVLTGVELVALTDVDNPLFGERGAARTYGPQKGATEAEVAELDRALEHLARLASDPGEAPGDGAAGGLGYGLRVFAGARRRSGIDFVLEATRFEARLDGVELVLTGEGRLDAQSADGKVLAGVCRRCRAHGVPAIALVGSLGAGAELLAREGLTAWFAISDGTVTDDAARRDAASLLERLAERTVRDLGAPRPR